ncbi:response regulator transcription factor [Sphingobacterium sp.]|uniref:response regulator transcription factor n=1 Tax=Sphingobacterium sp. TaxID=341027 RepID=UPI0028B1905A|nr:response regulator transcription factor [Sphingobacterium sp.]
MIRTVICDDHPLITQGLTSYLAAHDTIEIIASTSSAKELREIISKMEVDVLLLDIQLPDGNGIDLCIELKQERPDLQILALSNLDDRNIILRMLNGGASGYLLKSAAMVEIVKAINHIHEGGVYLDLNAQKSLGGSKVNLSEEFPPITRREKEVIKYLSEGLSSVQIAEIMFVSPFTVDTHRRNLMQKFNVNKTVNLLQKVKDLGLDE